jgi:hypothetical protein
MSNIQDSDKINMKIEVDFVPVEKKQRPPRKSRNTYMKEYMANSNNLICSCGGIFKKYSKYIHVESKKHNKYIANNPNVNVIYKEMKISMSEIINE